MSLLETMPGEIFSGPLAELTPEQVVLSERLRGHVQTLSERIGARNFKFYEGLQTALQYLRESLRSYGYDVYEQAFEVDGQSFVNLETANDSGPFVLVGAHYDSVYECPGANDNASGVAGVLELARLLAGKQHLRFALFANEEPPFYKTQGMGSVHSAARLASDPALTAMVCLETLGYYSEQPGSQRSPVPGLLPDPGNFVAIVGNSASAALARQLVGHWQARVPFPCLGMVPTPEAEPLLSQAGMAMSDHASFWQHGIPAVMVTDTVYYRYDYYHEMEDTWEKLTYPHFARVIDGLAKVLGQPL